VTTGGSSAPRRNDTETCDVLVVGSGAGGLSTAVTAAHRGAKVIVLEKEAVFGGTTAWSGGWMWIPRNPLARQAGIEEDAETIRTYLRANLGPAYDDGLIEAFLEAGPQMVSFFQDKTALQFVDGNRIPDMHGDLPGAGTGGRSVCASPYDGRKLGNTIALLRKPLPETAFFGMGIASGADLARFMSMTRSPRSAIHVIRRLGRHLLDLAIHKRGMHLVNGNALAARLVRSALDAGVDLRTDRRVTGLIREKGSVTGVHILRNDGSRQTVYAKHGVVLASGGFPHDPELRRSLFPHVPTGHEHWSAAPSGNAGDGIRMAQAEGAELRRDLVSPGAWVPVSLVPRRDGSLHPFPHFIDRAKPGLIAVRADGCRFVNEANGYHDVLAALLQATPEAEQPQAWLICDHHFLRRYGLGHVRPAPVPIGWHIKAGYLKRAKSLDALARLCGIDPDGLEETAAAYNFGAQRGEDNAFGRGASAFNRAGGDAQVGPNPCVAPICKPPYYAVRILPGSMGTFAGLRTDASTRVLDASGEIIPGLHAVGSDMASIMGGTYPAGGINLGPAMTFGFVAGRFLTRDASSEGSQQ
jgi:succinate dehydrogenase/fumarate reductase flavoprotein subunit